MIEATFTVFCIPQKHHWCVTVSPQLLWSSVLKWINDVSFFFFFLSLQLLTKLISRFVPVSGSLRKIPKRQRCPKLISCAEFLFLGVPVQNKSLSATFRDFSGLQTILCLMAADKFQFKQSNRETNSNLLSAVATCSLPLQMSEHPRCQRQTFTSRSSVFASHL